MKSTKIMAASFCNSKIYDSELNNCHFQSSSLTGIDCKNARFIDCIFDAIIWENAKFFHCILENVILKDINIEFVCFDNTEFIGTKFPFASIPFSFKCLEYILNTEREIKISSEVSVDGISRQEYLEKLPHLIKFYSYTKNYFPLANILVAINELDEAFVAIKQGVIFSIKLHEYRTLKYFSVLMMLSSFTGEQKSEIYELINSELNRQAMSSVNTYGSSVYLFEIRDNLLNGREKPYVSFEIYADIDCKSSAKLSTIINSIESMMTIFGSESNHYIEFRHNSPFQFLVGFFSNTQNIVALIAAFYLAYKGSYKFYNDYLDTTQKKLEIIKIKEEIKHLEKTNSESLNVEVFDESEALQKLKEVATQISNTIYANNIIINTVNHNVYNVDVGNYGYNFQEYNLK
ncbi:MAG: pentapeptide repeat-containing protein [Bacteroidales bacterium]|nr:pentapeptide repeat-containing protein [Bacteroidales bacterium]